MAERVYPSAKPANGTTNDAAPTTNGTTTAGPPPFPATKAARPGPYRPQPPPKRRHGRSCCCSCCLWTTLLILLLLLLAAIAGAVFYVLYRPHRPSFSLSSLSLSKFNLTDTSVSSSVNFTLIARNPNKKISFSYDPTSVKLLSDNLLISETTLPAFMQRRRNTTTIKATLSSSNKPFPDGTDITPLKTSVKNKNLLLKIQLDTKVKAKIGSTKTKNIRIRVTCDGIKVALPAGKAASTPVNTSKVKCKVDPRFKIFKWTV